MTEGEGARATGSRPDDRPGSSRRSFTPDGLRRLREAALRQQPWRLSAGPRSAAARAQSIVNGRRRQKGELSIRQLGSFARQIRQYTRDMAAIRRIAIGRPGQDGGEHQERAT